MKISSVILILFCLLSCQSHSIKQVTLNVESTVNDHVQIFINESYTQGYTEENSIKKSLKKGENIVRFNLDAFDNVKAIRIDLGDVNQPRKLFVKKITLSDGKITHVIAKEKLNLFFEGNHEVIFDEEKQCFTLDSLLVKDPFIVSKNLNKLF